MVGKFVASCHITLRIFSPLVVNILIFISNVMFITYMYIVLNFIAMWYSFLPHFLQMVKIMDEFLEDYNQVNTAQMKLVLFNDAVRHVCRIGRVIRQPLGNALLLGMGGKLCNKRI